MLQPQEKANVQQVRNSNKSQLYLKALDLSLSIIEFDLHGKLIEGYTSEQNDIENQWAEFNSSIKQLQMPFFYVPGNHDYTNQVMAGLWQ